MPELVSPLILQPSVLLIGEFRERASEKGNLDIGGRGQTCRRGRRSRWLPGHASHGAVHGRRRDEIGEASVLLPIEADFRFADGGPAELTSAYVAESRVRSRRPFTFRVCIFGDQGREAPEFGEACG